MESGEEANMTLDDFQAWYNKKKPKTFSGMVKHFIHFDLITLFYSYYCCLKQRLVYFY